MIESLARTEGALNSEQVEATEHLFGPMLVLAGAGTGKTKVLTTRIANLIKRGIAKPYNILAVTFTNKAAKEMQERVNSLVESAGLNIGTFHSLATKMLRANIQSVNSNLSSSFTIIDQDEQISVIKAIATENSIDIKAYVPKTIHIIISRWKDQGILPEKLSSADIQNNVQRVAQTIYHIYQKRLQDSNTLDFGDLLLYCNEMLINNPEILSFYQNKFQYILIDEYQDTNAVQYVWARMLANKHQNICCVGDDDQSIYSWRGAEVQNILRFSKDFHNAKVIKLEQNYRSSKYILRAADSIISLNRSRHGKTLWTNAEEGAKLQIISCFSDKEEARFVGGIIETNIKKMQPNSYGANQIAILVRAGFQTRAFEEIFINNAIPYQIIGGLRFYERKEIRDILSYIRLSININDNLAFERIINTPRRSIGNVTLLKIKNYAGESGRAIFAALEEMLRLGEFKSKTATELENFVTLINDAKNMYDTHSPHEVVKFILEKSGYLQELKEEKTDEARGRIENIYEMLRAIGEFKHIQEFVEHASLVMDNETLESDFGGAVKIMTLHASKGLEFDLVFLPGWEEGIFPHQRSIMEEGEKGLEEERRIAYVGITRARKQLYITHAESRRMFNETIYSLPSRFLTDIPNDIAVRSTAGKSVNYLRSNHNIVFNNQSNNSRQTNYNNATNTSSQASTSKLKQQDVNASLFKAGSRVEHVKFGKGIIIRRSGTTLEIAFEKHGIKNIKEEYVSSAAKS
jgi:DNA helicase-2/ATP-dependent DNA helicase PcrA